MAVYIGTGDTEPSGDFLLCQFLLSPQTIAKNDNNLLSFTETFLYCVQHFFRFDGKMQLFRKIRCFAVDDIQHDDFVAVPIGANRFIK